MRLFVAVEVGAAVERAVLLLAERLRERVARLAPRSRVSWVAAGRIHLTLAFIGEVEEEQAVRVAAALHPPLPGAVFQAEVRSPGVFPPRGTPRVLWVGIDAGREKLLELERDVRARLVAAGVPIEKRPYHPHLTLGRVREAGGLRTARLFDGLDGARVGTFRVHAITLFQSRPSPHGPDYVALQQTVLGGAGGAHTHGADA